MKSLCFSPGRRNFIESVFPLGTLFCLGCSNLLALSSPKEGQAQAPAHKFQADSGMSFQDVYRFAFAGNFVPLMESLGKEIGREKLIEMLKKACEESGRQIGQNMAKSFPNPDFASFNSWAKNPDRFWQHVLTFSIVEDTEKAFQVKITECLWAKTFRDANAADIGYAVSCHGDFAMASGYSPNLSLVRTQTLMQGDAFCNHRYLWEG